MKPAVRYSVSAQWAVVRYVKNVQMYMLHVFLFFFLTCWLCRLFCRVKAFSSLFSPSKIKKDLSLSCTFPQSHTSLGCQFSAQGVRLQLLLFCNGYYYFKWCAFILTSWEDLMFQGYMHFWMYTMPVVQEELLPFNPSLYEYLSPLTAESKLSEVCISDWTIALQFV